MLVEKQSRSLQLIWIVLLIPLILACQLFAMEYCVATGGEWVEQKDEKSGDVVAHFCDYSHPYQEPESAAPVEDAPVEEPADVESEQETSPTDQSETAPNEVDTSVPDGVYVGTTTLPDYFDNMSANDDYSMSGRTIAENEITIIVSPYGEVSGGIIFVWLGDQSVPIDGCVTAVNVYSTASLSGQITETGGTIEITDDLSQEIWRSGCPSGTEIVYENHGTYQAKVSIIGNRIIHGDVPGYFSFEATKR